MFNRLVSYESSETEASYRYNADNLRAVKTVNGVTTEYVWNGQNLAGETTGAVTNAYTYDMTGVHIANKSGIVSSYLKDYHGNIVGTCNVSGAMNQTVSNRMDYDAYGNQLIGNTPDPFGYCGEYYDSESGLIYLRNRYYDSTTGRFITEDPIKDGLNWYSYCAGNPISFVDPLGLEMDGDEEEFGKYSEVYKRLVALGKAYNETNDSELRADYHAEAQLIRSLERARVSQKLQPVGVIYPNSTVDAVDIIKKNSGKISDVSNTFNMPKAMIASILYREIICYNVADWAVDEKLDDSSRGIGQIKPSTAMSAEEFYDSQNPNSIVVHSIKEIKSYLSSDSSNIYYVALVLWHCAKQVDVWVDSNYDYSNSAKVLARYNGTGEAAAQYGNETHEYLDPFVKYYWEVD